MSDDFPMWNVFPMHRIPIHHIRYFQNGNTEVTRIGWVITPNIQQLRDDMDKNNERVGGGINFEEYDGQPE